MAEVSPFTHPNPLAIATLFAALVGHVTITVTALNVSYGHGWVPRPGLKALRVLHDVWLVAGTPWLAWLLAGFLSNGDWRGLPPLLQAYLATCAIIGAVATPGMIVIRSLRRLPDAQLSNHSHTLDIATQLGRRPFGDGPHQFMAHWPWNEQFQLEAITRTYRLPRVPRAWDGLSMLHISDLHFTGTIGLEYFEQVIEQANQLDCDIVAVTGDLVDIPCRQPAA